jgi:YD repeat-containing protein
MNASKDTLSNIELRVRYPDGILYSVAGIDELRPQEHRMVTFMIVADPGLIRINYTGSVKANHVKTDKASLFPGAALHDQNTVTIRDEEGQVQLNGTAANAEFQTTYTYDAEGNLKSVSVPAQQTITTEMPSASTDAPTP